MALSKKGLMINITMNELYNTHALILQHIDALVRRFYLKSEIFIIILCCSEGAE